MEVTIRRGGRRKQLLVELKEKETILEIERGSSRSHCVESSLWKRLWTCRKRDSKKIYDVTGPRFTREYEETGVPWNCFPTPCCGS